MPRSRTIDATTAAGRVLMVGLPGPTLDRATSERLVRLGPGGVILFARNLIDPDPTAELLKALRALLPAPALFGVDQEGGRVSRLEPWIGPTLAATDLAARGPGATRDFGQATGRALRSLGFNVDFAPVVDVCAESAPNGIGNRSFGTDAARVAELAGAFLLGLQEEGVAGCLKHFPGLGATSVDSHLELPTAGGGRARLDEIDLLPFRRLAGSAAMVMVGHAHYPFLEEAPGTPATLSRRVLELLRSDVGFDGLAVADDLEMGAVAPLDERGRAAAAAIEAGCDLLLYCADLERAARAKQRLEERAAAESAFRDRLLDAAERVAQAAERWTVPGAGPLRLAAARTEIARIRRLGATS